MYMFVIMLTTTSTEHIALKQKVLLTCRRKIQDIQDNQNDWDAQSCTGQPELGLPVVIGTRLILSLSIQNYFSLCAWPFVVFACRYEVKDNPQNLFLGHWCRCPLKTNTSPELCRWNHLSCCCSHRLHYNEHCGTVCNEKSRGRRPR